MQRDLNTFEQFYKLGFDHLLFKKVMGLKKPKLREKLFYLTLISIMLFIGILI
jgi:hypothetical protein